MNCPKNDEPQETAEEEKEVTLKDLLEVLNGISEALWEMVAIQNAEHHGYVRRD